MSIDVNCAAWQGFRTGEWRHLVNVRNFIQKNYTPYTGDAGFLAGKLYLSHNSASTGEAPPRNGGERRRKHRTQLSGNDNFFGEEDTSDK